MKLKNKPESQFLNEHEVAALLKISVATVRKWRYANQGPQYWKVGSSVKYTAESVHAFVTACPTAGGAPIPQKERPRPFNLPPPVPVPADLPAPPDGEKLWDPLKVAAIMTDKLLDK